MLKSSVKSDFMLQSGTQNRLTFAADSQHGVSNDNDTVRVPGEAFLLKVGEKWGQAATGVDQRLHPDVMTTVFYLEFGFGPANFRDELDFLFCLKFRVMYS